MTATDIVRGVMARDERAAGAGGLADFCHSNHRRLVGLLALYTGDRLLAEELAQEAFVNLCRDWPKVRRMDSPPAWLNSVAVNLANSRWRRRAAERRAVARHASQPAPPAEDTATVIAVRNAVAALPRRQRTVVVLRFYAGMSVEETAEAMSCAAGTVKSLTNRAVTALRRDELIELKEQTR